MQTSIIVNLDNPNLKHTKDNDLKNTEIQWQIFSFKERTGIIDVGRFF